MQMSQQFILKHFKGAKVIVINWDLVIVTICFNVRHSHLLKWHDSNASLDLPLKKSFCTF